ncbi:MAG: helix-turn-helix domain-containing protein, partial [Bacteroidota bacterium]
LSDLLKKETGKSAKAHINEFLISKAKTALLTSSASVSEIAYDLGFEYPQSLSRLFKAKTGITPLEYRNLN